MWVGPMRVVLLLLIAPPRLLEGEHWTTNVLGGMIYGCFWLVGVISIYHWVWHPCEQRSLVQKATPSQVVPWHPRPERRGLRRGT